MKQPEAWHNIKQTDIMHPNITPEFLISQGFYIDFTNRFWNRVDKNGGIPPHRPELGKCWNWIGSASNVRGHCRIAKGGNHSQHYYAHRASWLLHNGSISNFQKICRKCDNARCVNPDHLFQASQKDSMVDASNKERMAKVLTWKKVRAIRKEYADSPFLGAKTKLARRFGVSVTLICGIIKHKWWVESKTL